MRQGAWRACRPEGMHQQRCCCRCSVGACRQVASLAWHPATMHHHIAGEATAIVLAKTTALGGSRHAGLQSLRDWASASGAQMRRISVHCCSNTLAGGWESMLKLHPVPPAILSLGRSCRCMAVQRFCCRLRPHSLFLPSLPADANAQALFRFLASSSELPETTRRWPAWRQRLVPRIVLALSGRHLGSAPAASGAAGEAADGRGAAEDASRAAAEGQQQADCGGAATGGQEDEQQQQQQQDVPPAAGNAAAVKPPAAADASHRDGRAKENRRPAGGAQAKAAGEQALATTAAAHAQRGSSGRQRRANSQLAGFWVEG